MSYSTTVAAIRNSYPRLLNSHPLLQAKAVLATPPVREAVSLIFYKARRARASISFWAHPQAGKSSCITALKKLVPTQFENCAFVVYEPSSKDFAAEGALIEEFLAEIAHEGRIERSLAGKRNQLQRALLAMAATGRHLFLVIDEAQNLHIKDFGWLKRIINWLSIRDIKITVVLFGQSQLLGLHDECKMYASDLAARFMAELNEFRSLRGVEDMEACLRCCDEESEYPVGSGWTYTQYLWPEAYEAGFRLSPSAVDAFEAFRSYSGGAMEREGISMQWVAEVLLLIGLDAEDRDSKNFSLSRVTWEAAVRDSGYERRPPQITLGPQKKARNKG